MNDPTRPGVARRRPNRAYRDHLRISALQRRYDVLRAARASIGPTDTYDDPGTGGPVPADGREVTL